MAFFKKNLFTFLLFFLISCHLPKKSTDILVSFSDSNELYGYKDLNGNIVIQPKYPMVFNDTFYHRIAFVADSAKGIIAIDREEKFVLKPFVVDNAPDSLSEGLFRFIDKVSFGFADADGKIIIPATFNYASGFKDGLAAFCVGCWSRSVGEVTFWTGGKWGFIDKQGNKIIEAKYDAIGEFENGTARVMKDTAEFFIDTKGQRVERKN